MKGKNLTQDMFKGQTADGNSSRNDPHTTASFHSIGDLMDGPLYLKSSLKRS